MTSSFAERRDGSLLVKYFSHMSGDVAITLVRMHFFLSLVSGLHACLRLAVHAGALCMAGLCSILRLDTLLGPHARVLTAISFVMSQAAAWTNSSHDASLVKMGSVLMRGVVADADVWTHYCARISLQGKMRSTQSRPRQQYSDDVARTCFHR